jgi:hypothetical protein
MLINTSKLKVEQAAQIIIEAAQVLEKEADYAFA